MIFIYFPTHLNFSYPSCSNTNSYLSFTPKFSSDWSIPIASIVSWTSLATFLSHDLSETALIGQRILSCQACSLSQSSLPVVSSNMAEGFLYFLSFFFFPSLNLYSWFLAVIQIRELPFLEVLPSCGPLLTVPTVLSLAFSGLPLSWTVCVASLLHLLFCYSFLCELTLSQKFSINFGLMIQLLTSALRMPLVCF